jgi:hypothetical protein
MQSRQFGPRGWELCLFWPLRVAIGCRTQPLAAPVPNKDQPTVSHTLVALSSNTGHLCQGPGLALVDRPESLGLAAFAELSGVNSGAPGHGTAATTVR